MAAALVYKYLRYSLCCSIQCVSLLNYMFGLVTAALLLQQAHPKARASRTEDTIHSHSVSISKDPPKTRVVSPVNSWTEEEKVAMYGDDQMDAEEKLRVINAMKKMRGSVGIDKASKTVDNNRDFATVLNASGMRMSTRINKRR